jgi:hypothetical protein
MFIAETRGMVGNKSSASTETFGLLDGELEDMTEDDSRGRGDQSNPIGTVFGATFGPFGAAVGSVVSEDRFAFKFSVGTGANGDDDGFDEANAATVEIEDGEEASTDEAESEASEEADEAEAETNETAEAADSDESNE